MENNPPVDFWQHVKTGEPDDCWLWTGPRDRDGYGRFTVSHKTRNPAHRVSYTLAKGPIPFGMVIMHSCDNPGCCNPAHLSVGTQADNVRDCRAKGRARGGSTPGEKSPNAKLAATQVLAIRKDGRIQREIAAHYGVSLGLISMIKTGRAWAHLSG